MSSSSSPSRESSPLSALLVSLDDCTTCFSDTTPTRPSQLPPPHPSPTTLRWWELEDRFERDTLPSSATSEHLPPRAELQDHEVPAPSPRPRRGSLPELSRERDGLAFQFSARFVWPHPEGYLRLNVWGVECRLPPPQLLADNIPHMVSTFTHLGLPRQCLRWLLYEDLGSWKFQSARLAFEHALQFGAVGPPTVHPDDVFDWLDYLASSESESESPTLDVVDTEQMLEELWADFEREVENRPPQLSFHAGATWPSGPQPSSSRLGRRPQANLPIAPSNSSMVDTPGLVYESSWNSEQAEVEEEEEEEEEDEEEEELLADLPLERLNRLRHVPTLVPLILAVAEDDDDELETLVEALVEFLLSDDFETSDHEQAVWVRGFLQQLEENERGGR